MTSSIASTVPLLEAIIDAYSSQIVRLYVRGCFHILRNRFLDEIGLTCPSTAVSSTCCGFGLFALYFAKLRPGVSFEGFDYNERRIDDTNQAAVRDTPAPVLDHRDLRVSRGIDLLHADRPDKHPQQPMVGRKTKTAVANTPTAHRATGSSWCR